MNRRSFVVVPLISSGNLASIYYEQGNLEMAINHYKQAIARDAGFLEAYNNLVSIIFSMRN